MRRRWFDRKVLHRVLVHTVDERTIEGCVLKVTDDGVALIQARYIDGEAVSLAGEVFIPRERIAFVQHP